MKNIIIADIDGTLSIVGKRLECIKRKPPDWDEFYERCDEDKPFKEIINLVNILHQKGRKIILCSGRRESVREKTVKWLKDNGVLHWDKLLLRKDGDTRHDTVAKPELLKKANIQYGNILFILEDRDSMVKHWRSLGLTCLQVAEGEF